MSRKVLVTGANGFVAHYLTAALLARGDEVVGVDIAPEAACAFSRYHACDLQDAAAFQGILKDERPQYVVHLAAVSSVAQSWGMPADTFRNNTGIFLNLVESVRTLKIGSRILSVGSSEEYGVVPADAMPISETRPVCPSSPYAVARVAQEQLSLLYAKGMGMDIVLTRSFNQIGPGQRTSFVVPSFIRQLKDGRARGEKVVKVAAGDLSIVRDFLDVRDAVAAYLLLLDRGVSGEIYNICSGRGHALREVLETAARLVGVGLEVVVDPARLRPADNPVIIGDNAKMRTQLGWHLDYALDDSLKDMIA